MVISCGLKCDLCDHLYRIRVGVGFDGYQKHYFDCSNCNANIVFALRAKAPEANVESVENCSRSFDESDVEPEVLNFHPNCAFVKDDLHNPFSFPSLVLSNLISPHMRYIQGRIQSVAHQFDIPNAPHKWSLIKGMMTTIHKDNKKAARFVQQYTKQRNNDMNPSSSDGISDGEDVIVYESGAAYPESYIINEFFDSLFYPKLGDIVRPIIDAIDAIDKDALSDFVSYWQSELREQNQHRYLNTFSDYFRHRDHFGQIVIYSRIEYNVDELIVSSKGFDQIKLYYGDAYEALTSNMTILACLNNVMDGRKFDEFKLMTLTKYLEVNKANKSNPFKSNPLFSVFAEEDVESSIRNGSHHASIWHDGEKIMYRSGGTGAQHDIPYTRYLDFCNKLTIKLAAIFIIEHYLSKHVSGSGYFIVD
ncbi:hypothetical protein HCO47_04170 [Citrobacter braakii]|jgi:hypothetical protein|nr:hypothetical protein [Citrobacter braakii]MBJ9523160.1 hypothetical protein [Citrobacter braakii]NMR47295.1 hypothetical protein [Citrobacter braakii]